MIIYIVSCFALKYAKLNEQLSEAAAQRSS